MNKRIVWIDWLRSLCMLYIIGHWHIRSYVDYDVVYTNIEEHLTTCVLATFTFLSGYFSFSNRINTYTDVLLYYKRKLLRIYPLFVIACVGMFICGYNTKEVTIRAILGIGELSPSFPVTLWYASMLLLFFFLTPYLLFQKNVKARFLTFFLLEITLYVLSLCINADGRLFFYWIFYYLGIVYKDNPRFRQLCQHSPSMIAISCIFFIILGTFNHRGLNFGTFLCCLSFIFFICNFLRTIMNNAKHDQLSSIISSSSFCAYLFHRIIYYYMVQYFGLFSRIQLVFNIVLVIAMSWLIQHSYDYILSFFAKRLNNATDV